MSGTWGKRLQVSLYGESHGPSVGVVLNGLPSGFELDLAAISFHMGRRRPGQNAWSTPRRETDRFEIESGLFEGRTTGTPLCARIPNRDTRSKDYGRLAHVMRPSHADYAGRIRYGGAADYRGGGHFSGRLTAPLVFAGSVARQMLASKGVVVRALISSVGSVQAKGLDPLDPGAERMLALQQDARLTLEEEDWARMRDEIEAARAQKDSVGGTIQCVVQGLAPGLGDPFFHSLESHLSSLLFSVPAVKGVSFGDGFALAKLRGSQANDEMRFAGERVVSTSNHNGGILGGISTGMPVVFSVAVKPTPSIGRSQRTVDLAQGEDTSLAVEGRHDPCIVPRALPVVESAAALAILDQMLWGQAWN